MNIICFLIERKFGKSLYNRINTLVIEMIPEKDITNKNKQKYVESYINKEYPFVTTRVINLIINITLIKMKGSGF